MKHPLLRILLASVSLATANATEFRVYKATASIAFSSSIYENDTDRFVTVKMSNKQLINLALGQPQKTKVSKDLTLVALVPAASSSPLPVTLAVLNTKTSTIARNVAGINASSVLAPTDISKPIVALVSLNFAPQTATDFAVLPFTLSGSGVASAQIKANVVSLNVVLSGLHGEFNRTDSAAVNAYAEVVTKASLRVSGKPIATLDL